MCNCEDKKERRLLLTQKFEALIQAIEANLNGRHSLDDAKQRTNDAIKLMENRVRQEIIERVTDDGKRAYSNQEARDTAVFDHLDRNTDYQRLKSELKNISINIIELDNNLDILKYKFKAAQALVELEKLD